MKDRLKHVFVAYPRITTIILMILVVMGLLRVWYSGFSEGWRQANEYAGGPQVNDCRQQRDRPPLDTRSL